MSHTLTWALNWSGLSFWRAWFPARVQARWLAQMITRPCTCGMELPDGMLFEQHTPACRKGPYRSFQPGGGTRFVIHIAHAAFEIVENDGRGRVRVAPCAPEGVPF